MSYDWDGVITYNEQQAKVRKQFIEVAAFLDRLADRIDALDLYDPSAAGAVLDASTVDCRAMAAKLRGEP